MALPKIISVNDHVVEPPHVWQTWLPAKYRERGPKVVDKKWGGFKHLSGAKYDMHEDDEGDQNARHNSAPKDPSATRFHRPA